MLSISSLNTDLRGTNIGVGILGNSTVLKSGDEVNLINVSGGKNAKLITDENNLKNNVKGMQGIAVEYQFKLKKSDDDKRLIAELLPADNGSTDNNTGTNTSSNTDATPVNPPVINPNPVDTTGTTSDTTPITDNGNTNSDKDTDSKGTQESDKQPVVVDKTPTQPTDKTPNKGIGQQAGTINPQTKSLSENKVAAIDGVNRGSDLALQDGMNNLQSATQTVASINSFGAIGGGKSRTQTGSYIDVSGVNLLLGAGTRLDNGLGSLHIGGFVEAGFGDYTSVNDFAHHSTVTATGKNNFYGLGAIAKQNIDNTYLEGSVRFGKTKTDYHSSDFQGATSDVSFTAKSSYQGFSVGAGHRIPINDTFSVTPYGRLLYTHYADSNHTIQGQKFTFDSVNSLRTQLGTKVTYDVNNTLGLYSSLTWEREHKGTASGKVLGLNIPQPSIKGNTGIVEAGINYQPNANLNIGLGVNGSFGKRKGAEASATVQYDF